MPKKSSTTQQPVKKTPKQERQSMPESLQRRRGLKPAESSSVSIRVSGPSHAENVRVAGLVRDNLIVHGISVVLEYDGQRQESPAMNVGGKSRSVRRVAEIEVF